MSQRFLNVICAGLFAGICVVKIEVRAWVWAALCGALAVAHLLLATGELKRLWFGEKKRSTVVQNVRFRKKWWQWWWWM